ncbi:MAG: phosphoribosylformimino-5-aminoimidazole carboxamide ribotide isomerase [Desulfurivibrionaceae bacterium]
MRIRPCIDLHKGRVKQIVGSTLSGSCRDSLQTNFTATRPPSYYARLYKRDGLSGGHVIMLGPGNEEAAAEALAAWPGGLQIGGGITPANGPAWLEKGAAAVIVTSYVFQEGHILEDRLREMVKAVGRENLVIDLSCRKREGNYYIVTDQWQKFTTVTITKETLDYFARFCSEFLIHAVDVEGKCSGVERKLVEILGELSPITTTYAGGIAGLEDLEIIKEAGQGRLDATIGSSLDIFGGNGITYAEALDFHRRQQNRETGDRRNEP